MKRLLILSLLLYSTIGFSQKTNDSIFKEIKRKAVESHSDAVLIIKDGSIIYEDYFGKEEKPIYIASAGKSLTSLAIGKLTI